jgi:hypothetical protein
MKRVLVLVAAVGLILPAAAQAGTFQGIVIAKSAKRHALVTASKNGTVRTVRGPRAFRKIGLGAVVSVRATKLPDGTFAARGVRKIGLGKRARVRASVVKRSQRMLYLSAGHSVFSLALRKGAGATLRAGDRISATASVGRAQLFCDDAKPIGHDDEVELEGIYLSTDDDVLSLAVHGRGLVKVTIPGGFDLPELNAGDEIWLLATVEPDGTFTLVSLDNEDADDEGGDGDDGVDMGDNWFAVTGVLSSLSSTSVAVDVERHPEPVRCSVPPSVDLSGFSVGQVVEMACKLVEGRFVLVKLRSKTAEIPGDGASYLDLKGFIAYLDATKVAVGASSVASVMHESASATCAVKPGEDLRGFAVGDFVEIQCKYSASLGKYVLYSLSSDHATLRFEDGQLKQWFELNGLVSALTSTYVAVEVAHHAEPVQCSLPAGMDLRGFTVGDAVDFACVNEGSGFYVKAISSDSANWPEEGTPAFTLQGVLKSMRVDGVGVQGPGYAAYVNCAMPSGTDLSGFAIGDTVELRCHFHDGRWNLASLTSDHAQLTLEE